MKRGFITVLCHLMVVLFLLNGWGLEQVKAASAKAKAKKGKGEMSGYIFFPSLPTLPRYQYLTTFSDSQDIQKKKSKFFKFVAGDEEEKPRAIKKAYGVDILDGVIYVCDVSGGVIVTMDLKKNAFDYMGLKGPGKMIKPVNLVIDKESKLIYVADMGRKEVLCLNPEGELLRTYGEKDQFNPVAVDHYKNKLYVCDVKQHQIFVIEKSTGMVLDKIGKVGSNDGELYHPTNICIRDNRLYVSDTNNFRIQVFDLNGKFLSKYGQIGLKPGNFSRNKGIAVDKDGLIYVVDSAFENVQVFDNQFQLLLFMLGPGVEKHNINLPAGIAIDYDNLKYFKKYLSPKFHAEYLLLVTSNFGKNKINVYAYGNYQQ